MPLPEFKPSDNALMTVDQIILHVKNKTGGTVVMTRQGIHYWIKNGVRGVKLRTESGVSIGRNIVRVRKVALDEFLHNVEVRVKRA